MQIVIDIPAEDFEKVKCGRGAVSMMRKAIIHGTPLPDGVEILTKEAYSDLCTRAAEQPGKRTEKRTKTHACDCISRQAAKSKAVYSYERHEKVVPVAELDWLPYVDPERKPGHWEWDQRTGEYVCSECGCNPIYERTTPDASEIDKYRYCRWCGAKMKGADG